MVGTTDSEEFDKLKDWLKQNGTSLVLGVAVGLGGVYGWRFWQSYQLDSAQAISADLHAVQQHISDEQYEQAATAAENMLQHGGGALPADLSRLLQARAYVEQQQLDKAIEPLRAVMNDEKSLLNVIARLRLARVYLAQEQLDEVENLLPSEAADVYAAAFAELKGDLKQARGHYAEARAAYQAAVDLSDEDRNNEFLQMKLDALPAMKDASDEQDKDDTKAMQESEDSQATMEAAQEAATEQTTTENSDE